MNIRLTFQDFSTLASSGRLEKSGVASTFDRPLMGRVKADPSKGTGEVVFYLDETDDHRFSE